jgi:hypothetical protein
MVEHKTLLLLSNNLHVKGRQISWSVCLELMIMYQLQKFNSAFDGNAEVKWDVCGGMRPPEDEKYEMNLTACVRTWR